MFIIGIPPIPHISSPVTDHRVHIILALDYLINCLSFRLLTRGLSHALKLFLALATTIEDDSSSLTVFAVAEITDWRDLRLFSYQQSYDWVDKL